MNDTTQTAYVTADASGRILSTGSMPRWMIDIQTPPAGGSLVMGDGHWDTDYVTGGAIVPRPANPATLNGMTLENLPTPSVITVEGVDHDCTDGHCELSFSHAGTYTVKVAAFPYLDATFQVTQA